MNERSVFVSDYHGSFSRGAADQCRVASPPPAPRRQRFRGPRSLREPEVANTGHLLITASATAHLAAPDTSSSLLREAGSPVPLQNQLLCRQPIRLLTYGIRAPGESGKLTTIKICDQGLLHSTSTTLNTRAGASVSALSKDSRTTKPVQKVVLDRCRPVFTLMLS